MKIRQISEVGKRFIAVEEGLKLKPYRDSKGVPTIGLGNTFYEDGRPVRMTDKPITKERALKLFDNIVKEFEAAVNKYITAELNQNQFDALVSFTYNVGTNALQDSTLRKMINKNPNDSNITAEFKKWKRSGNNPNILLNRRIREAAFYFKPVPSSRKISFTADPNIKPEHNEKENKQN